MATIVLPQRSLVLVGGVPGSGKSSLLANTKFTSSMDVFKISADDVRGAVQEERGYTFHGYVEHCIEPARERFFDELHEAWSAGENIVIEAAYLTRKSRAEMIKWAEDRAYAIHMFLVTATWRECVAGVVGRNRTVPIEVLADYWREYQDWLPQLQMGKLDEGLASVHILDRNEILDEVVFANK